MWKIFSRSDLAHTPAAVRTMAAAALAASFFLALLCGLFYNAWAYEVDRILRGRAVTGKASPRMRLSGRIIFFGMLTK